MANRLVVFICLFLGMTVAACGAFEESFPLWVRLLLGFMAVAQYVTIILLPYFVKRKKDGKISLTSYLRSVF